MLQDRYHPAGNPTVVFANAEGAEVDRTVGYNQGPKKYKAELERILRGEETYALLKKGVEDDPGNVPMILKLAAKYSRMGRREEGKALYQKVLDEMAEKAKALTVDYNHREVNAYELALFMLGNDLFATQDVAPLNAYIAQFPDGDFTEKAYTRLSNFYIYMGDQDEASAFFKTVKEKYPHSSAMMSMYVKWCERNKMELEEALEVANRLVHSVESVYNGPWISRARIIDALQDSVKLDEVYGAKHIERRISTVVREFSQYSQFWMKKNRNIESALKAAKMALCLAPENVFQRFTLAQSFARLGKMDDALEVFGPEVIEESLDDENAISLYIRFWSKYKENIDHALALAEKFLVENPESRAMARDLAAIYLNKGRVAQAVAVFGNEQMKPYWDNAITLNNYAWFWAERGENLKPALKASLRSLELEENHLYLDTAALIYWKLGTLDRAIELQEKALEKAPGNAGYTQRLAEMKAERDKQ